MIFGDPRNLLGAGDLNDHHPAIGVDDGLPAYAAFAEDPAAPALGGELVVRDIEPEPLGRDSAIMGGLGEREVPDFRLFRLIWSRLSGSLGRSLAETVFSPGLAWPRAWLLLSPRAAAR
jgi:hypothetical protein